MIASELLSMSCVQEDEMTKMRPEKDKHEWQEKRRRAE